MRIGRATVIRTVVLVGAIGALEIACRSGAIPATMLIAPSAMVRALVELVKGDEFGGNVAQTLWAVAVAMGLSVVGGFAIGFALHWVPAMVAMIVATLAGLDRVPRVLLRTARVHRLSLLDEIWRIRLPAAAPHLLSGVKLAVAYSFIGVIAGEFILSTSGIGHEIAYAYDNFDNPRMYALILFVLAVVTAFNMTVYAWERRLARRRGTA